MTGRSKSVSCWMTVLMLVLAGPASARDSGEKADRVLLPQTSFAVASGAWGVARIGAARQVSVQEPRMPRLREPILSVSPGPANPLLNYSTSSAECVLAQKKRDLGIVLTAVCAIGLPLGFLGAKVGHENMNAELAANGYVLIGVAAIGLPVGLVSMGVAASENKKHGCWGPDAREVEPPPAPKLVFDGFETEPEPEPEAETEPEPDLEPEPETEPETTTAPEPDLAN